MGEDDWDPSELSFVSNMIAGMCDRLAAQCITINIFDKYAYMNFTVGSMAGLAEHVAIFPIDTLKTHVQCERCGTSSWNCAVKIIRREGLLRMWRGVSATFMGCVPGKVAVDFIFDALTGHKNLNSTLLNSS